MHYGRWRNEREHEANEAGKKKNKGINAEGGSKKRAPFAVDQEVARPGARRGEPESHAPKDGLIAALLLFISLGPVPIAEGKGSAGRACVAYAYRHMHTTLLRMHGIAP